MKQQVLATRQVLAWKIGDRLFGMDIIHCRDVEKDRKIVPVPHAKAIIAGIVNLRGDVVTVIDLKILLGGKPSGEMDKYVLVRLKSKTQHIAIKADAISDVITIREDQVEAPPAHLSETEIRYISAVAVTDRGLLVILNPDEILGAL